MLSYGDGLQENLVDHSRGGLRLQRVGLLNSVVVILWMTDKDLLWLVRRSEKSRRVKVKVLDLAQLQTSV